jgi:trk system potassium uptake protein TrkA
MYIVIIGCGTVGSLVANSLSKEGHDVVVIDNDETSFENLSSEFSGFRILGDGGEVEILKQADIEKAEAVFLTTRKDNLNLTIAQVAKTIFGVPCVVARIFDPKRGEIFSSSGIKTISPTRIAVEEFLKEIKSQCH